MIKRVDMLPPSRKNPRNSEGSMADLGNGTLLFAYTHFTGGTHDAASAFIGARYSHDYGESWTEKSAVLVKNEGRVNTMSVSLLRLKNGDLLMGYLVKDRKPNECRYYVRKSSDNAATWSDRVLVTGRNNDKAAFCVNNDRLIQLKGGRIIVPAHCAAADGPRTITAFYSDDNGASWKRSRSAHSSPHPEDEAGFQEPGIVELKNGRLLMWMRTILGTQFFSHSSDKGVTWTEPAPSMIVSPLSPLSIRRIPATGDLLAVYNDSSPRYAYVRHDPRNNPTWIGERTPLIAAISKDEGRTWGHHTVLEDDPEGRFCYTSILFVFRKVILSYTAEKQKNEKRSGWGSMRVTLFDYKYLYA